MITTVRLITVRNRYPADRQSMDIHLNRPPLLEASIPKGTRTRHPHHASLPPPTRILDLRTAITFITTVRPYIEPYIEPLLWRGVSWFLGDAERPADAVREVERFKERQREKEKDVMEALGPYIYHERVSRVRLG